MIQMYYWREHLPTGHEEIAKFTSDQIPDMAFMPFDMLEGECKRAIAKWNREGGDTWLYDFIGVRNKEVAEYEREKACLSTSR